MWLSQNVIAYARILTLVWDNREMGMALALPHPPKMILLKTALPYLGENRSLSFEMCSMRDYIYLFR